MDSVFLWVITATVVTFAGSSLFVSHINRTRKKEIERVLGDAALDLIMKSLTTRELVDGYYDQLCRRYPSTAVNILWQLVIAPITKGTEPLASDVEKLHQLKPFQHIDPTGCNLDPDACYMVKVNFGSVYFYRDLTLAGYKDFQSEIEAVMARVEQEHRLRLKDVWLLTYLDRLKPSIKSGQNYGGPGAPFPDLRYECHSGKYTMYLDEELGLISMSKSDSDKDTVIWERPDARRPELYL